MTVYATLGDYVRWLRSGTYQQDIRFIAWHSVRLSDLSLYFKGIFAPSQPSIKGSDKPYHLTPSISPNSRHQMMLGESDGTPVGRRGNVACQRHSLSLIFFP